MKIKVSVGNSRMDKKWNLVEMELDEFRDRIAITKRTAETVEQYKKLSKAKQDDVKDVGGFVLGVLKNGRRKKDSVVSRSALCLDMDYAEASVIDQIEMFFSFRCWFYSTHKHTPEKPRFRLIVPLSRDVTPDEYMAVGRKVAEEIGIEQFDDTTYEPSRLMYWPSTSSDGEFIFREIDGALLDPDAVLAKYVDWHNTAEWPVSKRQVTVVQREVKKQADPLEKPGTVGAFCRTYSVQEAIETFLTDVYKHSAMPGRFDYIPADSQAGVVIYDDKYCYSHHATDPACGKLLNAFDVVRLHRFGALDAKADEDADPGKLPSFKAMQEFAVQDEGVKLQLAKERQLAASREFTADADDWQSVLELDKQGRVKDTLTNLANIVRFDPNLRAIVYNEFKCMVDVIGEVPWKQVKPGWGDADIACAKVYFERVYGIWSPTKFKDALLAVISAERVYHPIKDYFDTLSWDGEERVDRLLVDYLGAEDNAYTHAVTRKTLCAAVARVYEPGVKFDSILVLNGPQGIGKSTLFARLGREWYSDSLTISDMRDKTAAEKLQGYWILELGELAGIKKVDVETVKSFITRTDDKFRQSYGVTVESHPRNNVIVGSTNSESGFLRDVTGNRRFWPVLVTGKGNRPVWSVTPELVNQIWAEAIVKYRDGEELYLKGDVADLAYGAQQEAMEADDREGVVSDYLDRLLPENWDAMDLYQRRSFLGGSEFDGAAANGTVRRNKVCIMEIWCECFCKERQNLKRTDSYEIEGIIMRLGEWEIMTANKSGKSRYPLYGPQKTFVRHAEGTANA